MQAPPIRVETIASIVARMVLGVFIAGLGGVVGWFFAWMSLHFFMFTMGTFLAVGLPFVGGLTGAGAAASWWNVESRTRVAMFAALLTVLVAVGSAALAILVSGQTIDEYTWIGRGLVFPMIFAAMIGGNLVGLLFYAFRAVVHREV